MTELARFTAHGHSALRARHAKTLEFTAETQVTARATCILGVGAVLPATAVAGPIRLTLLIGSDEISLEAMGNSSWQSSSSAVVRRSAVRRPDTYATDATLAAADLPRPFAALLADPAAAVEVVVARLESEPWLVRFRLSPTNHSRLRVEAAAADQVIAEDVESRAVLAELGIAPGGSDSGRTLVVAAGPLVAEGARADEVIGYPAELAVVAASGFAGPVVLAGDGSPAEIALLAAGNPTAAVVFRAAVGLAAKAIGQLNRPGSEVVWVTTSDPERPGSGADLPERGEVIVFVGPPAGATAGAPVDPAAFVRELLAQDVTPRTVALALASLPGWSRRSAYDFVLSLPH